jgi:hypothetical protein
MTDYTNVVLTLDNAAHNNNRARLHAVGCSALRMFNGKRGKMQVTEELESQVAWLNENGYPVKACKCLKGSMFMTYRAPK